MAESTYSREQVEQWHQKLEVLAQKPRTTFTKKQAVEELIDTVEKALETRSYEEVASGLKEWGLDISAGSLKQYVTRYRRSHQSAGASSSRKRTAKSKKKSSAESVPTKADSAASDSSAKTRAKAKDSSGTKPGRFIDMDEDL